MNYLKGDCHLVLSTTSDWIPKMGEMIEIGVPSVNLSLYEFIAIALIFNGEFCYPRRMYATI